MHVITDVKNYQIVIACLSLFSKLVNNLTSSLLGEETKILEKIFEHLKSKNRGLKETASVTLVKFCLTLSLKISEQKGDIYFEDLIGRILIKLKLIITQEEDPTFLIACLQAYGAMARSIKVFAKRT